jgi:hypothetical protein
MAGEPSPDRRHFAVGQVASHRSRFTRKGRFTARAGIAFELAANLKRVQRLMRCGAGAAAADRPASSRAQGVSLPLARSVDGAAEPGVTADITYIPIGRGFLYLMTVMDWAYRVEHDGRIQLPACDHLRSQPLKVAAH